VHGCLGTRKSFDLAPDDEGLALGWVEGCCSVSAKLVFELDATGCLLAFERVSGALLPPGGSFDALVSDLHLVTSRMSDEVCGESFFFGAGVSVACGATVCLRPRRFASDMPCIPTITSNAFGLDRPLAREMLSVLPPLTSGVLRRLPIHACDVSELEDAPAKNVDFAFATEFE